MNTRLQQFISAENISQSQFADTINVARASVSHILSGRNKPGWDFLINMQKHFPDLNIEWFMTGVGKMYKSQMKQEPSVKPSAEKLPETETEDNLFSELHSPSSKSQDSTPQESRIPAQTGSTTANIAAPESLHSPSGRIQVIDNQRKISKIVVFYDDNTFIEIR